MPEDLALPPYYLITPEPDSDSDADLAAFLDRLSAALSTGLALVQLRVKTLDAAAYAALAADAIARCRAQRARLIVNGPIDAGTALALGASGVHLGSAALRVATARPLTSDCLLSAACHSLDELLHAERIGADFATLSPVLPTLTHPGAPTLGWTRFADYAAQARMPVYALGGMTREHLATAREHRAHGIASIRGLW
ncbi:MULTISPECIES: thiamine phosphate synthase [Burkholderia]|uniref:Thiamine-phosphate phosphorylase n=1 Tax=Burkholderia savannae TaxID=1637837 RepID=A0ABR5T678_9BURK|nr:MULTISPECIES: thiamine phosphate synthase [Burkholderia]AOJ73064.1 thiamine-phosphate phosphorylase [Burkholderia savannae]KVG46994.1 thiamine-phosphate phosphorylase [Burkholderia sp. MSMB0265]KVG85274.1 thiamine-phosphate phosphorylase [Burkholderia sp. MSMB2040]KVG91068.1 thiamine-phosphate phosphorylase [Burkholderia sp. MSMB2041]KVG95182.1 thiamine-phosphate phosphorylase [Burkholderia sp. MSMB2042]